MLTVCIYIYVCYMSHIWFLQSNHLRQQLYVSSSQRTNNRKEFCKLKTGVLVGIGNPLLDLEADVPPEFLKKWKLKEDDAVLCNDKLIPMFFDLVDNYKVQFIAGGSTQNSLRVAQWMIGKPHSVTYFGCIGGDHFGHVLRVKAEEVGMNAVYQIRPKEKTGTCATCIVGQSRSLCAHLAAANLFSVDYLELQENWKLIEKARYFYVAGFFMSSCLPAIYKIAEHADNASKYFMMNLSATFICSTMKEHFVRLFPYIDVLFGNEKEAFEIAKALGFESQCLKEVVICIANIEKASNRSRLVVVTQGPKPGACSKRIRCRSLPTNVSSIRAALVMRLSEDSCHSSLLKEASKNALVRAYGHRREPVGQLVAD
ncbi:Adenosine kinase [Trichinella sp. T8]|nr:Adenosine kinase [Trichinella sp. T8]